MNILILDDKPTIAQVTARALQALHCRAFHALDAAAAARLLEEEKFDALFLDLNLAGENGFEVWSRLPEAIRSPMVIFTSHSRDEIAAEARRYGNFHFLAKPFTLDELRQLLAKLACSAPVPSAPLFSFP